MEGDIIKTTAVAICLIFLFISTSVFAELRSRKVVAPDGSVHVEIVGSGDSEPEKDVAIEKKEDPIIETVNPADKIIIRQSVLRVVSQTVNYTEVSYKFVLYNDGPPATVLITVHGVDKEGYEVLTHSLRARMNRYEEKTLTDKRTYRADEYGAITEWKVKEKSVF